MPPIIWTSKWRIPIVRREVSRTTAKVSGSSSSSDSPLRARSRSASAWRAQLVVVEQLELGLPLVDALDALGVLLELLAFAKPEGAVEDRHGFRG